MKLSASILSCAPERYSAAVRLVTQSGADWLHLDVMDGCFVPRVTYAADTAAAVRALTGLPLDVHLMAAHPYGLIDDFASAGADILTIHAECQSPVAESLRRIRAHGLKAGLSVRPATPVQTIFPLLPLVDLVLVMTVEPGLGGQTLLPDTLDKLAALRGEIERQELPVLIQADGGINLTNAARVAAYADVAVLGTAFLNSPDPAAVAAAIHAPSVY